MQSEHGKRRIMTPDESGLGELAQFGAVWPHFCQFLSAMEDAPRLRCCNKALRDRRYVVTCVRMRNSYGVVDETTQRARRMRLSRVCMLLTRIFEGECLTTLVLAGCWYATDTCLEVLWPQLPNLTTLDLGDCRSVSKSTLGHLATYNRNLEVLSLRDVNLIDDDSFKNAVQAFTKLKVAVLLGCDKIADASVAALQQPTLEVLNFWGCHHLSDVGVIALARQCTNLVELNLRYCHLITDHAILVICEQLKSLRHLNLRYLTRLTNVSAHAIANARPPLEYLNISQCPHMTDVGVIAILQSITTLKDLRLRHCKLSAVCVLLALQSPSLQMLDVDECTGTPAAFKRVEKGNERVWMFDTDCKCHVRSSADTVFHYHRQSVYCPSIAPLIT